MSDFLSSLRENYGALPDTSTVRGIGDYADLWLSGEERTSTQDLELACQSMISLLGEVILDTKASLATTGPTHDDLADPMERTLLAYERLQEVLEDLMEVVSIENRDEASAASRFNIRVERLQFHPCIVDFHLPIDTSLG